MNKMSEIVVVDVELKKMIVRSKVLFKIFLIEELTIVRFFEKDIDLNVPGFLDQTDVGNFLRILNECEPSELNTVKCALENGIKPVTIFVLSDYLLIESVFDEISMNYCCDKVYTTYFLQLYINYYSVNHPKTIEMYEAYIATFQVPRTKLDSNKILNSNISEIKK